MLPLMLPPQPPAVRSTAIVSSTQVLLILNIVLLPREWRNRS
jgi:hypothetical protein